MQTHHWNGKKIHGDLRFQARSLATAKKSETVASEYTSSIGIDILTELLRKISLSHA